MNSSPPLDQFGEFLMRELRDEAIDFADGMMNSAPNPQPKLQAELQKFSPEQQRIVRRCVVESVDAAIHNMLFTLGVCRDQGQDFAIMLNGYDVMGLSDGLQGELFGDQGWHIRYSKHGGRTPVA